MKHFTYIFVTSILFFSSVSAQTINDRKEIYQVVINNFADNQIPLINESFSRIYDYDIDGNYDNFKKQFGVRNSSESPEMVMSFICVNPIIYTQTVVGFLKSKNIEETDFSNVSNYFKVDSLSNYILSDRLISSKKAPLLNSTLGNIFRKKQAIGLSRILFDQKNKLALVKVDIYSKNKMKNKNASKIFILQKVANNWIISGSLEEKQSITSQTVAKQ